MKSDVSKMAFRLLARVHVESTTYRDCSIFESAVEIVDLVELLAHGTFSALLPALANNYRIAPSSILASAMSSAHKQLLSSDPKFWEVVSNF